MDQTSARKRAKELNESGEYDTVFIATTKSHLKSRWADDVEEWVVVESSRSTLHIVEE